MKTNKKIFTILFVYAALSLLLCVFLIWPLLSNIARNSAVLISAKNSMVSLSAEADEIKKFDENYQLYKPNLEKMDQMFVDANNPVDFIEFLEGAASDSQITSQISLPPASQSPNQSFIIMQSSSTGSFLGISKFAKEIEAGPYLIEIENLSISNSEESSGSRPVVNKDYASRKVDATFTIKVFTKK